MTLGPGETKVTTRVKTSLSKAYSECSELQPGVAVKPSTLEGKPCVAGTRIPVSLVLRYIATNEDPIEGLGLTPQNVEDCLEFGALLCDYSVSERK